MGTTKIQRQVRYNSIQKHIVIKQYDCLVLSLLTIIFMKMKRRQVKRFEFVGTKIPLPCCVILSKMTAFTIKKALMQC